MHQYVHGFISFVNDNMTGEKAYAIKKKKIRLSSFALKEYFNLRKKIAAFSFLSQAYIAFNVKISKYKRLCKTALKQML